MAHNPRLKGFGRDAYQFQAGRYNVLVMTPILEWYLGERETIRLKRLEAKKLKKLRGSANSNPVEWDWSQYESQLQSVVYVVSIPDFCQTTASVLLSGIAKGVTQLKYKTSYSEMTLLCDGKEIQPIHRDKFQVELPYRYGTPEGAHAFAGRHEYLPDAFDRNRCQKLELRIDSESGSEADTKAVPGKILKQVMIDFEGFQNATWKQ